jgi:hypothetical protein
MLPTPLVPPSRRRVLAQLSWLTTFALPLPKSFRARIRLAGTCLTGTRSSTVKYFALGTLIAWTCARYPVRHRETSRVRLIDCPNAEPREIGPNAHLRPRRGEVPTTRSHDVGYPPPSREHCVAHEHEPHRPVTGPGIGPAPAENKPVSVIAAAPIQRITPAATTQGVDPDSNTTRAAIAAPSRSSRRGTPRWPSSTVRCAAVREAHSSPEFVAPTPCTGLNGLFGRPCEKLRPDDGVDWRDAAEQALPIAGATVKIDACFCDPIVQRTRALSRTRPICRSNGQPLLALDGPSSFGADEDVGQGATVGATARARA